VFQICLQCILLPEDKLQVAVWRSETSASLLCSTGAEKVQEGDVGALRPEYLPCDSTVSSFSYEEALILSEIMLLSQISNET